MILTHKWVNLTLPDQENINTLLQKRTEIHHSNFMRKKGNILGPLVHPKFSLQLKDENGNFSLKIKINLEF